MSERSERTSISATLNTMTNTSYARTAAIAWLAYIIIMQPTCGPFMLLATLAAIGVITWWVYPADAHY